MNTTKFPLWLVKLVVVVALPTFACFGYYSLELLGEEKGIWAALVILAYPVFIIGFVGLFRAFLSSERTKLELSLWMLCIIVPIAVLLWVWV